MNEPGRTLRGGSFGSGAARRGTAMLVRRYRERSVKWDLDRVES
jgi:hypothetical protein